jgi:hypothetical protein
LRQHPTIQQISRPIVTVEDFKSALKYVPEKTASYCSGRSYHHYKAYAEGSSDGLIDAQVVIHAAFVSIMTVTHGILFGNMETRHVQKVTGGTVV